MLDLRLKLKDESCLPKAGRCIEGLCRLLGEVTGVDSVECAILDQRSSLETPESGVFLASAVESERKARAEKAAGDAGAPASTAGTTSPSGARKTGAGGYRSSRRRPELEPTFNGQPISRAEAKEREEQAAHGETHRAIKIPSSPITH